MIPSLEVEKRLADLEACVKILRKIVADNDKIVESIVKTMGVLVEKLEEIHS